MIIAGDLKSKSPLWGSLGYNWRGRLLEEWINEKDLCVINSGTIPTCVRPQGCSVVYITLASASLVPHISNWEVIEDTVTLSDHKYISFYVGYHAENRNNVNSRINSRANNVNNRINNVNNNLHIVNNFQLQNWSWTTLCEEDFRAVLTWHNPEILDMLTDETQNADMISFHIKKILAEAADFSAKRKRSRGKAKSTYWWNDHIASLRADTLHARRQWMRYQGKRNSRDFNESRLLDLRDRFKTAKSDLRCSIRKAKSEA